MSLNILGLNIKFQIFQPKQVIKTLWFPAGVDTLYKDIYIYTHTYLDIYIYKWQINRYISTSLFRESLGMSEPSDSQNRLVEI